jgi:apolipoprotein D and lipocalin family protein
MDSRLVRRMWQVVAVAGGAVLICGLVSACKSAPTAPPLPAPPQVDLARYMGDWYVIGNIPTPPEKNAFDAIENYQLRPDGRIATTFRYRDGSFDAPEKTMTPVGTVVDRASNAVWTMQFIWPIEADYRILYIDPAHSMVVVGREKRDYLWIMSRKPTLPEADYERLLKLSADLGYDVSKVRRVPQRAEGSAPPA